MSSERERIELLIRRDGYAAARQWVERTRAIYAEALSAGAGHAALADYRPRFEEALEEFDAWLARPVPEDAPAGPHPPA